MEIVRPAGYTLVICEKPDSARRVSDALSDGTARSFSVEGATAFRFRRGGEDYVVCSAQGHLYGVSDPAKETAVYPVFDVEWERSVGSATKIAAVRKLSAGAAKFVNACDFDVEGETIGFNLLRYACGGKEGVASRAKFSTLTKEDLVKAFSQAQGPEGGGLARAGRARHVVDFLWGVNLTRLLSRTAMRAGSRYRTISVGRVQGPTLKFVVEREKEIRSFVPLPFWKAAALFAGDGKKFWAEYEERIGALTAAKVLKSDCERSKGVAASVSRRKVQVGPPDPFNIGGLQKEAYRVFRYPPRKTLQIAERLYLTALISYPRTDSQRLPPSIGYGRILRGLEEIPKYSALAGELLRGDLKPVQGPLVDPAHPAIHPTGENPRKKLDGAEAALFDLIARRFLAAFAPSATRELTDVELSVGRHKFRVSGGRTTYPGWANHYGSYSWFRDAELPQVVEDESFAVSEVKVEEKFEQRPPRFTQGSLLERMEKEGIGTKATRADIISTLLLRGYVKGESLEATDLGMSLTDVLEAHAPSVTTTRLTRDVEERLEAVESRSEDVGVLMRETVRMVAAQMSEMKAAEEFVGADLDSAAVSTRKEEEQKLGPCPVCSRGDLRVVVSRKSRKRFVGCSEYRSGCRASAPLPQRGKIAKETRPCEHCGWPIVTVVGRRPWTFCVNMGCPSRRKQS